MPWAVGMQGSLIVGVVRDVLGKTKTYRRKKKRTKRNCASLQGTSSKKQVKAEQAYWYGKHLSHQFHAVYSGFQVLPVELGFRMSIVSGIPDS